MRIVLAALAAAVTAVWTAAAQPPALEAAWQAFFLTTTFRIKTARQGGAGSGCRQKQHQGEAEQQLPAGGAAETDHGASWDGVRLAWSWPGVGW